MPLPEAGIDVVLSQPLDGALLLARVRSLVRSNSSDKDWELGEGTSHALGFAEAQKVFAPSGRAVLVGPNRALLEDWTTQVAGNSPTKSKVAGVDEAINILGTSKNANLPDVFALAMGNHEPEKILYFLATLKSNTSTRHCAVLVVQTHTNQGLDAQALDIGANNLMQHGFQPAEMALRINILLRRKKNNDTIRAKVRNGLEAAVSNPFTGLHNRRYAMPQLDRIVEHDNLTGDPFAVMIEDMDHFKQIDDNHGNASGDAVLLKTAKKLAENLRAVDMIARIGGEEFLIVMPGAQRKDAQGAAHRLCHLIGDKPLKKTDGLRPINATISIGLAVAGDTKRQLTNLWTERTRRYVLPKTVAAIAIH